MELLTVNDIMHQFSEHPVLNQAINARRNAADSADHPAPDDPVPDDPTSSAVPDHLAHLGIVSAADLMAREFPEPTWVVAPYLCEGVAIVAGAPKIGKSWLALGLALAVASGTRALDGGADVEAGEVLYLALEDNDRRLQHRMRMILGGKLAPSRLHLVTRWKRNNEGGIEDLKAWLELHPNARLMVIDTLAKVRERRRRNGNIYEEDYDAITALKDLADEHGVCILLVHHTRKSEAVDVVDEVNGATEADSGPGSTRSG